MTAVHNNGHAPARDDFEAADERLGSVLEAEVSDLQEILDDELAARGQLQALFERSKSRERRLRKAIAALSEETMTPAKESRKASRQASDGTWQISEERIKFIRDHFVAFMADRSEPVTKTEFAEVLKRSGEGVSSETIAKAFNALREREVIRVAGNTRGGGKLWLLMPGGTDAA